jgi:hypothetical protein
MTINSVLGRLGLPTLVNTFSFAPPTPPEPPATAIRDRAGALINQRDGATILLRS